MQKLGGFAQSDTVGEKIRTQTLASRSIVCIFYLAAVYFAL